MTAPHEDELRRATEHDPGVPEDYAGEATDDGWDDDPVERAKAGAVGEPLPPVTEHAEGGAG